MLKETVFSMASPYRDTFRITGYRFGDTEKGKKACAIVGSMRGNEVQQLYIASKIIYHLKLLEEEGMFVKGQEVLVIPTINHYSLNVERRFWSMDGTDINRMFPGFDQGETTQRIAYHLFQCVKEYDNGIQLASSYMRGNFMPHVRMMKTDFTDIDGAKFFNLPYTFVRDCRPYDTTTLNYNWQLWSTSAYSLYSGATSTVDDSKAQVVAESILNFLIGRNILHGKVDKVWKSHICYSGDFSGIATTKGGFFIPVKVLGDQVTKGDCLCQVIHPYQGTVIEEVLSPCDGTVFFSFDQPFVQEGVNVFRIAKK